MRTDIRLHWAEGTLTITPRGDTALLPEKRTWQVECMGFAPCSVSADGRELPASYDEERGVLRFTMETGAEEACRVCFSETALAKDNWLERAHERLHRMQTGNNEKEDVWRLLQTKGRGHGVLTTLRVMCHPPGLADCLEEVLLNLEEGDA